MRWISKDFKKVVLFLKHVTLEDKTFNIPLHLLDYVIHVLLSHLTQWQISTTEFFNTSPFQERFVNEFILTNFQISIVHSEEIIR